MALLNIQDKPNAGDWMELVEALEIDRLLGLDAGSIAGLISTDPEEIVARQQIFRDCVQIPEIVPAFEKMSEAADSLLRIQQAERGYSTDIEKTLYSIKSLGLYTETVRDIAELGEKICTGLFSSRLREFFETFKKIAQSEEFKSMDSAISEITDKANNIKSFTLAVNLNAQLAPSEIGIVSVNSEYFLAPNVYTKFFGKIGSDLEYATPLVSYDRSESQLDRALYTAINKHICKAVRRTQREFLAKCRETVAPLFANLESIKFIGRANKFVRRLAAERYKYRYPEVSADEVSLQGAYDPTLLGRVEYSAIVGNAVEFDSEHTVNILTGVNSGGKSVYLRSVGINQVLFQLGLCVTAESAKMKICDSVYAHLSKNDVSSDSRFVLECQRMKYIIDRAGENTLVLMDETFSSTNSTEGAAVAFQVLKNIQAKKSLCVYSTHILELKAYAAELNGGSPKARFYCTETREGKPTYKIKPGFIEEKNYAYEIAKKYGLEFVG